MDKFHEQITESLHNFRFEADKLLEVMNMHLLEQRNFINHEINRGMRDNHHTRRIFHQTLQNLLDKKNN